MPRVRIPINVPTNLNVDESSLSNGEGAALIDGYVDETASNRRRPGLVEFCDLSSNASVDGLYWWDEKGYGLAVSNGHTYKLADSSGTVSNISGASATTKSGVRPVFASDGTYVVIASGEELIYTDGSTKWRMGSGPNPSTHVAYLDKYMIANESGSARFQHSAVGNSLSWDPLDVFTAETLPDQMLALRVGWRELVLFGKRSIETWYDDGSSPFSRLEGAYVERGVKAKYSIAFVDNTWFFLDEDKNVVMLSGRTAKSVSEKIQKEIWSFSTVDDAIGDVISMDGRNFYVITFPTAGRTFAYEFRLGYWSEWSWWNPNTHGRERWRGNSVCWAKDFGFHLIGDHTNGKIYKLLSTDYRDMGASMRTSTRSPWIDHGNLSKKRCSEIGIRIRRGDGGMTTDPVLMVRWRDNGSSEWQEWRHVSMGKTGDTEASVTIKRLGIYRSRQWEFAVTDNVPLTLVGAEVVVDKMEE